MNTRRYFISAVLFAVATMTSAASFAKDDAREALLRSAEKARFAAQVDADASTLDKLLDDGLEYTHSNGDLDSKKSFIDSLTSGTRDYLTSVATIETVRIFGDVGVIRGKAKVTVGGKDRQPQDLHIGYTDIWLWRNGSWKMTAWRSARLPDSPVK
jgi:uncharacterized protein DUF4440